MFDLVASGGKKEKRKKRTTDFGVMLMLQDTLISQNTVVTCRSSGDDIYAYPPSLMQHFHTFFKYCQFVTAGVTAHS